MRLTQFLVMILLGVGARRSSFQKICSNEICSKCARLLIYETIPTIKKIWWVSNFIPGEFLWVGWIPRSQFFSCGDFCSLNRVSDSVNDAESNDIKILTWFQGSSILEISIQIYNCVGSAEMRGRFFHESIHNCYLELSGNFGMLLV